MSHFTTPPQGETLELFSWDIRQRLSVAATYNISIVADKKYTTLTLRPKPQLPKPGKKE